MTFTLFKFYFMYIWKQVLQPWIEKKREERELMKNLLPEILEHLQASTQGSLLKEDGTPDLPAIKRSNSFGLYSTLYFDTKISRFLVIRNNKSISRILVIHDNKRISRFLMIHDNKMAQFLLEISKTKLDSKIFSKNYKS